MELEVGDKAIPGVHDEAQRHPVGTGRARASCVGRSPRLLGYLKLSGSRPQTRADTQEVGRGVGGWV